MLNQFETQLPLTSPLAKTDPWRQKREHLRAWLARRPPTTIGADEIDVHFSAMPAHYWERVTEADLLWGLEAVHGFLGLLAASKVPATTPYVNWRHEPETNSTRVVLCTWDRLGLLAKAAAAFSTVRLNILRAEVFTRKDNVALDLFSVTDSEGHRVASAERLKEMTFLLDGALSEPPRFASVWACSRHKFLAPPSVFPPRIDFDNASATTSTLIRVEAADRLGLLYDILQALADAGLNIIQADIQTENQLARDVIHVRDAHGKKLLDPRSLETLRRNLEAALTVTKTSCD